MAYSPKHVKDTYNAVVDKEDQTEKKPNLRTEIPREFIKKYIKKTDIVLDAGGGTWINAIMMGKICKHVSLIDISTEITNRAQKNIQAAKLSKKVDIWEWDISDLKQFKNWQFSFVVCVGDSISYVLENRFRAMKELVRVAKKGSILVIGCDSKYWFMRRYLQNGNLEEALRIDKTHETYCSMGPKTYVYTVDEMTQLLENNGCKILEIAATPALTDLMNKEQFHDPKQWAKLRKLEMEVCTTPELLWMGTHLLFIVKKK